MAEIKPLDLSKINIDTFCDLNGVDNGNRTLLNKLYKGKINSYTAWHDLLSKNFKLHPKKDFTPKPEAQPTDIPTDKKTKNK